MKKRILALVISVTLALSLSPALAAGVEEKFPTVNEYPGYADVPAGIWYEPGVKLCYETGLMTGTDSGFQPERYMKVSEVVVIAARMRETICGESAITSGGSAHGGPGTWFDAYVQYLTNAGVTLPENMDADATRSDFLSLLDAVLPGGLLTPINTITALPDTDDAAVLRFYNAGILTGTDQYGTFRSGKSLTRMEGAAMVSRVVREDLRIPFSPADYAPFEAAGVTPDTVFFEGGKTAGDFLPVALELIAGLESACEAQGIEFNWFNTVGERTFLDYVKDESLSKLGVTKEMGTVPYRNFSLQVFYSRYLDRKGRAA